MKTIFTWTKSHPLQVMALFVWGLLCGLIYETCAAPLGALLGVVGWRWRIARERGEQQRLDFVGAAHGH